jgi:hypothetical protein
VYEPIVAPKSALKDPRSKKAVDSALKRTKARKEGEEKAGELTAGKMLVPKNEKTPKRYK